MPSRKVPAPRIMHHMEQHTVDGRTIPQVLAEMQQAGIPLDALLAVRQDYSDYLVVLEWPIYQDMMSGEQA